MRYIPCKEVAALIRADLKKQFPNVKFSVRSSLYSGGASIDVRWIDGPTDDAVRAVVRGYAGATFDGQRDLMEYHSSTLDGELVRFGADFVHTHRAFSRALIERAVQAAPLDESERADVLVRDSTYRPAEAYFTTDNYYTTMAIHRVLSEMSA